MPDQLYPNARQGILDGTLNMMTATIKCLLATSGYHPNTTTDSFVSDVGSTHIVARSGAMTGKSVTSGVFKADHVTYAALTGVAVFYVVIYQDGASDSSSRLIVFIDTALGLPFTPNGGNVELAWDPNGIFRV